MDALRWIVIIAAAIVLAAFAWWVLGAVLTIVHALVTIAVFAAIVYVCFLVVRSQWGKRNKPAQ